MNFIRILEIYSPL